MRLLLPCAGALLWIGAGCAHAPVSSQGRTAELLRPHAAEWLRIARLEDARPTAPHDVAELLAGLRAGSPLIRAHAARAVGRLERPALGLELAPLLHDADAAVRAAAAQALAQSVHGTREGARHRALLHAAFVARPADRALLAEPLGRVAHENIDVSRAVVQQLLPLLAGDSAARLAALRGLHFTVRQPNRRAAFDSAAVRALRGIAATHTVAQRSRSLALTILNALAAVDVATVTAALAADDATVRRDAVAAAATMTDTAAVRELLGAALRDPGPLVRYEAVRAYVRLFAGSGGCSAALAAARAASAHVALAAIDLLGTACRSVPAAAPLLDSLAAALSPAADDRWHAAAHAMVSLARVDSARAQADAAVRARLLRFTAHPNFFVRTHAALAAGVLGEEEVLRRLAADEHANVRTAAVQALARVAGHRADAVYIAQLARTDSELLIAAAAALEGSPHPGAVAALLDALDTMTALTQETSRDARLALLERVIELGGAPVAARLERALMNDIDPLLVERAAAQLEAWSYPARPAATAAPQLTFPTFDELAQLERSRVDIELYDGRRIELQLMPFDAPTNAARFARLARRGYYDGLTFHRVVPNFVIQGGSPGANEYSGDGPFTRDEVGQPNWRGTVGLSTRGRDTGDAQFYINHIDNVRLDHQYTVFAAVTGGMDAVAALSEGARIRHIRIR